MKITIIISIECFKNSLRDILLTVFYYVKARALSFSLTFSFYSCAFFFIAGSGKNGAISQFKDGLFLSIKYSLFGTSRDVIT